MASYTYDPMVVEGKTYWYRQVDRYNHTSFDGELNTYEFGFIIGEHIEIDDELWNKIYLIKSGYVDSSEKIVTAEDRNETAQYIHEVDKKVRMRSSRNYSWSHDVHELSMYNYFSPELIGDKDVAFEVYDFNKNIENLYIGWEKCKLTYRYEK